MILEVPTKGLKLPRIEGADDLYRELRFDNTLKGADGKLVTLRKGARVKEKIEVLSQDVEA